MAEKSPEEIQKLVEEMREWLNKQPHLPKDLDDKFFRRFLHSCYYDIEKAKTAMELFFTLRANAIDLLSNRDPLSTAMQKVLSIVNLAQLEISQNRNLFIWQLNDPGLEKYDYVQDAKLFFLTTDVWILADKGKMEDADIVVMDVKDISLKFLTKFNVAVARKISKYQEDALPIRLKQIHIVNTPPFIDKIYGLMKPFLKQEVTNMIHFHSPKSDTIYNYLSKEDLPEDFGGTNGKMVDHMKKALEMLNTHREQLLNDNLWMAEKKSKGKADTAAESFRSLAID